MPLASPISLLKAPNGSIKRAALEEERMLVSAQRRDRSTWKSNGGHSMKILNMASASLLLAAATKSISLDKISY
jgi:hypothetical protein